jgi:hypothetical protein
MNLQKLSLAVVAARDQPADRSSLISKATITSLTGPLNNYCVNEWTDGEKEKDE